MLWRTLRNVADLVLFSIIFSPLQDDYHPRIGRRQRVGALNWKEIMKEWPCSRGERWL